MKIQSVLTVLIKKNYCVSTLSFKKICQKIHSAATTTVDNTNILNCTFLEAIYILNIPNNYGWHLGKKFG